MREMTFSAAFEEQDKTFPASFKHVQNVSDGGYERGYTEGKADGVSEGYADGKADGIEQGKAEGYTQGKADGINEGIEQGKQAEWSAWWDAYQCNGERTNYEWAYSGNGWTEENFLPKFDIRPKSATQMFQHFGRDNPKLEAEPLDLVAHLDRLGVVLDLSQQVAGNGIFYYARMCHIGVVDLRARINEISNIFGGKYIRTIDKVILRENGSLFRRNFDYCSNLENVSFEGTLGQTIPFGDCVKLTRASIESIINALSTTTTGLTATLSKTAVNKAFATTTGGSNGSTSAEWLALVATRSNWTIALA